MAFGQLNIFYRHDFGKHNISAWAHNLQCRSSKTILNEIKKNRTKNILSITCVDMYASFLRIVSWTLSFYRLFVFNNFEWRLCISHTHHLLSFALRPKSNGKFSWCVFFFFLSQPNNNQPKIECIWIRWFFG